jgi:Cu/Ag efflux protein CusF
MTAMTMSYSPDKEDIFKTVKVGDQITAKVHDGDMKTLYDVKIAPPAKDAPKK